MGYVMVMLGRNAWGRSHGSSFCISSPVKSSEALSTAGVGVFKLSPAQLVVLLGCPSSSVLCFVAIITVLITVLITAGEGLPFHFIPPELQVSGFGAVTGLICFLSLCGQQPNASFHS